METGSTIRLLYKMLTLGHLYWGPICSALCEKGAKRRGESKAYLLDTHGAELVAGLDTLLEDLARDVRTEEAARKGVARAVRVDDLGVAKRVHAVALRVLGVIRGHDGCAFGTVRDDDDAWAREVRLGLRRERLGDRAEVFVREAGRARPRLGLGLVADDDVTVGDDLLELHAEELGDERRGEVEHEDLGRLGRLLAQLERGLAAMGQEVALYVEDLGAVNEGCDLRGSEMGLLEFLRGTKGGNEGAAIVCEWCQNMHGNTAYRLWPVITTPQAPVLSPFLTR